jgi:hypothetical protein
MAIFWLMVVWADNPVGEALVEHGYIHLVGLVHWKNRLLLRCGLLICLVLILLPSSCKLFSTSAVAICQLNCCHILAFMVLDQG